jgi:hypothetical protein
MLKKALRNYTILIILIIPVSCIPYFGPASKTGFGAKTYKYKCKKAGKCEERIKEDNKKKEISEDKIS